VDTVRPRARGFRDRSRGVFPLSAPSPVAATETANIYSYEELVAALNEVIRAAQASLALILISVSDLAAVQARLGFGPSAALFDALVLRFQGVLGGRARVLKLGDGTICVVVHAVRNSGHALLAAERLKHEVEEAMAQAQVAIAPQLLMGIALCPLHARDAETLVRKAQLAAAGARTRDQTLMVYEENCAQQVLSPWSLGAAFVEALRSGALAVHYQPKVRLAGRSAAGVEALLRWLEHGRPVSTPDIFIPLAEQAGLIQDVTWYVLSNALRQPSSTSQLPVAANITAAMLYHGDFVEMIRTAVTNWSVPAGGLTLEITEGALVADLEHAVATIAQLRQLGVRISIDDFGTGYSSLSYFKKVPADELKIDKSFVRHMDRDKADQHLVEAIIRLAHRFNLTVVAEGVEQPPTLEMLTQMGCDQAQGYLLAPALDSMQLARWLQQSRADPAPC
jgi:EAL domain-containing protein (putative c-di-GMP-specific phosphodiesterase class I)/GGDEF domain-containing protein